MPFMGSASVPTDLTDNMISLSCLCAGPFCTSHAGDSKTWYSGAPSGKHGTQSPKAQGDFLAQCAINGSDLTSSPDAKTI